MQIFGIFLLLNSSILCWSFQCSHSAQNTKAATLADRPVRRLSTNRGDSLSSLRMKYEIVNNSGITQTDIEYFQNVVLHAADQFFANALKVYPVQDAIVVPQSVCGGSITVPDAHMTSGVSSADIVVYVELLNSNEVYFDGWACQRQSESRYNVIVGAIQLDMPTLLSYSFDKQFTSVLHCLTHMLGFTQDSLNYFTKADGTLYTEGEKYYYEDTSDGVRTLLATPTVQAKAKEHFACDTLQGLMLENQVSGSSSYSHWDARVVFGDYMVFQIAGWSRVSALSLAVLQDSGWYEVDWNYAEPLTFGRHKGCDFFWEKCLQNSVAQFEEFCDEHWARGCDDSHTQKTECELATYSSSLPSNYQYFSSSNLGGVYQYVDYCPLYSSFRYTCLGTSYGATSTDTSYNETVCLNCRCVKNSLDRVDSTHGCYEVVSCSATDATLEVVTDSGPVTTTCPFTGGNATVTGVTGHIECPASDVLCFDLACSNHCYGQGICSNGVCTCTNDSTEDDCYDFLCHSSCDTCTGPYSSNCVTCADSESMVLNNGVCSCTDGLSWDGSQCLLSCHENCATCEGDWMTCTSCSESMELDDNQCYCKDGLHPINSGQCTHAILLSALSFAVLLLN